MVFKIQSLGKKGLWLLRDKQPNFLNGQKIWTDISQKNIYEWPEGTGKDTEHHQLVIKDYSGEKKKIILKDIYTPIFIAALFKIAKICMKIT